MYKLILKPFIDKLIALTLLILLSPVFLIISLLLKIQNKSVFFIQKRPGLNEKVFKILKFKTMSDKKDQNGILLPDEQRLTSLGNTLRRLSLDEIPQLVNVILGDLSLVGPRPLLVEYLDFYSPEQSRRHEVKPGITGWAQVNGRNAISWEKKFELDLYYVENVSFLLDLKIIFLTIKKVLAKKDVYQEDGKTMENFKSYCLRQRDQQ